MTRIIAVLALSLALAGHVFGADQQPATDASLRRLMELTQTRALLDSMTSQMDAQMQAVMRQVSGGATPTPAQAEVLADMRRKMVAVAQEQLNWEKLEPEFLDIYRKSFTEPEVQGMIQFYASPTGQAMVRKMPVVMRHSMELMQRMIVDMLPRVTEIEREAMARLRQCCPEGR